MIIPLDIFIGSFQLEWNCYINRNSSTQIENGVKEQSSVNLNPAYTSTVVPEIKDNLTLRGLTKHLKINDNISGPVFSGAC